MAKNHPEGGIVYSILVKTAEVARAEAAGVMGPNASAWSASF